MAWPGPLPKSPACWRYGASASCACPISRCARLALAVHLGASAERLPAPARYAGLPMVTIDPSTASAPQRVALALDCALGLITQTAGAFATGEAAE